MGETPTSGFEKKLVDFDLNSALYAARENGVIGAKKIVENKSRMTSSKVRSFHSLSIDLSKTVFMLVKIFNVS